MAKLELEISRGLGVNVESHWVAYNRWGKERETFRENPSIIDLSFDNFARKVAFLLGKTPVSVEKIIFSNGEFKLRFPQEIEESRSTYLLGAFPNLGDILTLEFAGEYLRRKGVKEITAVCSFLGFTRQDKIFKRDGQPREEAISLKPIMKNLAGWVDRMIILEPHSQRTGEYGLEFGLPVLALSAWRYLTERIKPFLSGEAIVVAGPDFGRASLAKKLADYLNCEGIVFRKERRNEKVYFFPLTDEEKEKVRGKTVLTFDDVITKGETIGGMADLLIGLAKQVIVLSTHGEFAKEASENLDKPLIGKILVTDSRPPVEKLELPNIERVSLAPFLARVIREDSHFVNPWESEFFAGIIIE